MPRKNTQLYLAALDSHDPANQTLADLAGARVTVHGKILEGDGQHLISISKVEKAWKRDRLTRRSRLITVAAMLGMASTLGVGAFFGAAAHP